MNDYREETATKAVVYGATIAAILIICYLTYVYFYGN